MMLASHTRSLDLSRPLVMGVVNVTPDSFSDGGRYSATEDAVEHADAMLAAGASIIDIGAESTRPGSLPVSADVQLQRLLPVLTALRQRSDAFLSVDSGAAEVIGEVIAAGADMINDVYALRQPGALAAAAAGGTAVCLMHMLGTPEMMQERPHYDSFPEDIFDFLARRAADAQSAGISWDRIVLDPGFGFGKSNHHNLALLDRLDELCALGYPVLAGLSRKGTLGRVTGRPVDERLAAGLAAAVLAVARGASIIRTHDVPETVDALRIVDASRSAGRESKGRSAG